MPPRRSALTCCWTLWLSLSALAAAQGCRRAGPLPAAQQSAPGPRLVILGFDGVDPRRVADLMAQGKLPNIKAIAEQGYLGPLGTTNPPQSPVAWSAFATGLPAGEHGIFDFVGRDTETYFPTIATNRIRAAEVVGGDYKAAVADNLRRGPAFWDVLAQAGVAVRTLYVPYAYPPPANGARSIAGLGAPDVRGTNSTYTLFTADVSQAGEKAPAGGQLVLLRPAADGGWHAELAGPTLLVEGARQTLRLPVSVRLERLPPVNKISLVVDVGGSAQALAVGGTSPYVALRFVVGEHTIHAATRLTVRRLEPPELYVEPLSIDPEHPYLPLSAPPELAQAAWRQHGPHKTVGWVDDTSALGNGAMDEMQFVGEALATMEREAVSTVAALQAGNERVLISVFTAPDRVSHMFYRYLDSAQPAPKPDPARWASAIEATYTKMDEIVGRVRPLLGAGDVLLLMSDHGFGSFRRGFNLNRWLLQEGWLAVKAQAGRPRDFFQDVDWSKTRAYALGTGGIYLNRRGRERQGIVTPEAAALFAKEIAARIMRVRDGGVVVVSAAYLGDNLYAGTARDAAPDVRVAMVDGYRASWATSLGGIPEALFEDNTRKWSGDHASSRPEDLPGFLASSRPLLLRDPRIEDLSATACAFAGVPPMTGSIGRNLLEVQHGTRQ